MHHKICTHINTNEIINQLIYKKNKIKKKRISKRMKKKEVDKEGKKKILGKYTHKYI